MAGRILGMGDVLTLIGGVAAFGAQVEADGGRGRSSHRKRVAEGVQTGAHRGLVHDRCVVAHRDGLVVVVSLDVLETIELPELSLDARLTGLAMNAGYGKRVLFQESLLWAGR